MRIIDADVFISNVVKYSHQSTKTIGKALADTPTVQAVPIEVLQKIRQEIDKHYSNNRDRNDGLYIAMKIIDKYKAESEGKK